MILVSQWLFFLVDTPTPGGLPPRNDRSNGFHLLVNPGFSGFYPSERYPERVTFVVEGCITMYDHVLACLGGILVMNPPSKPPPSCRFLHSRHVATHLPRFHGAALAIVARAKATPLGDKKGGEIIGEMCSNDSDNEDNNHPPTQPPNQPTTITGTTVT